MTEPEEPGADRKLVRPSTAAELLDVSVRTIHQWITDGKLTGYRVGDKLIRVDLNEVENLILRPPGLR